jgi:hypothetical protein
MGSGILQIAAFGEQDVYLTGNPQMTFFKIVYKRHTNFAIESLPLDIDGNNKIDFGNENSKRSAIITKIGDLVGNIYLELTIKCKYNVPTKFTVNHFGNSFIKNVKLIIGSYTIDTHNSQWLQAYHELTENKEGLESYKDISTASNGGRSIPTYNPGVGWGSKYWTYDMNHINLANRTVGDCPLVFGNILHEEGLNVKQNIPSDPDNTFYFKKIYIPLKFWFNKHPGLALPLVSITNQEVKLEFEFETKENLRGNIPADDISIVDNSTKIYADYYYLDQNEKQLFKATSHEYLIEQTQIIEDFSTETSTKNNSDTEINKTTIDLKSLQHPVKYLSWVVVNPGVAGENKGQGPCYFLSQCSNSQQGNDAHDGSGLLFFSGIERFPERKMSYFTRLLPYKYCKGCAPDLDRIAMYSFSINPFDIEPSGTLNFSKINTNKKLDLCFANIYRDTVLNTQKKIYVFAVNYNILRIEEGYGGLLFI